MKRLVFTFVNLLCFFLAISQNHYNNHYYELLKARGEKGLELNGSEFVFDEWIPMKIYANKGETFDVPQARINLLGGSVEIKYKGEELEVMLSEIIKIEFRHNNKMRNLRSLMHERSFDLPEKGFVEVIEAGKDKVLVRHHKFIAKVDPNAKLVGVDPRPVVMNVADVFVYKGKKLHKIKSKKDLKDPYKNIYEKLVSDIEDNQLDIKDPYILASIIAKYRLETITEEN